MSKSIHLICRRDGIGLMGLSFDRETRMFRSVAWGLSQADANEIEGGWVYFHPTKDDRSEFGGFVKRVEPTEILSAGGKPDMAIILESRVEGRGQEWRGAKHAMAWWSGLVPKTLEHEQDER
jgi:hypothetical protein